MSHIGIATALGQTIDIPIVLRSLAGSFSLVDEDIFPIPFHPDILATLDTPANPKCEIVKKYELRWWAGRKPRDLNSVERLNSSTIKSCVNHYKQERLDAGSDTITGSGPGPGPDSSSQTSTGPLMDDISRSTTFGTGAGSGAGTSSQPVCIDCSKYRQLLSDVLQDVLKFKNFASTMSTCSETLLNIGLRRASTFNLLHEAAILKETAGKSILSQTSKTRSISEVSRTAQSELERLKNLPASSYKWTWGETLTKKDVLGLRRTGTNPGRVAHSGYDISLVDGKLDGWNSEDNSTNLSAIGQYDDMPVEASLLPPPTDYHFPNYFSKHDPRSYDPFHLSTKSISSQPNPPAPISGAGSGSDKNDDPAPVPGFPSTINLADNWSSSSGSVTSDILNPAPKQVTQPDNRRSGPESIEINAPLPEPAPAPSSVINLADIWMSGSGSDKSDAPAPGSGAVALALADAWSDNEAENCVTPAPGSGAVALGLADVWSDNEADNEVVHNSDEDHSGPSGPQKLADAWKDSDISGDEALGTGSSSLLRLAEEWKDSDSGNERSPSRQSQKEWSFGPEHFSFLKDNMFDYSSDEDI
jgi:hypothetical protein